MPEASPAESPAAHCGEQSSSGSGGLQSSSSVSVQPLVTEKNEKNEKSEKNEKKEILKEVKVEQREKVEQQFGNTTPPKRLFPAANQATVKKELPSKRSSARTGDQ